MHFARSIRIEIHIDGAQEERIPVGAFTAFETRFPESACASLFLIRALCEVFVKEPHDPLP
jgi:hypothetical protein